MSEDVFGAEPRHRHSTLSDRPKWIVIGAAVFGVLSVAALCFGLGSRNDQTGAPPVPDVRTESWYDTWPSGSPDASDGGPGTQPGGSATAGPAGSPGGGPGGGSGSGPGGGSGGGPGGGSGGGPGGGAPQPTPGGGTSAANPPNGLLLNVVQQNVPVVTDLTAEGTLDWIQWGLRDVNSVNHKGTGASLIADRGGTGTRQWYDMNPQRYNWTDGTPDGAVLHSGTGLYTCGLGNGFELSTATWPQSHTLRFYVGSRQATGRLEVSLYGTSMTGTGTLKNTTEVINNTVFVITYKAPADGRLLIRWTAAEVFSTSCGNVSVQAATLR